MPSWRSLPQTGMVSDCAGDTARFAITCLPSSTIPRWQPTTTEANGNCAPPQPIARSPAASAPTGAPTCSPPSAPLSELPHAEASTPIRPSTRPYAGSPFSNRVEQIHMAGQLLMFVLSCAEHEPANASLEHAYRTFSNAFMFARLKGGSRAYLAKAWADYAPVSHFWCALRGRQLPEGGKELAEFLGEAESLRRLGQDHKPRNSPSLLNPDSVWRVPEGFELP